MKEIILKLRQGFIVSFYEPCDCWELFGSVRHNNGGHYHRIVHLNPNHHPTMVRVREDSTADFKLDYIDYEPYFIGYDEAIQVISELLEKNWEVSIYKPRE